MKVSKPSNISIADSAVNYGRLDEGFLTTLITIPAECFVFPTAVFLAS